MNFPPIEQLLLHQGAMIFLTQVTSFEEETSQYQMVWPKSSPFSTATGEMPRALAIEAVAQAVGVHMGLKYWMQGIAGQKEKVGFLIAVTHGSLYGQDIPPETELVIQITQSWLDDQFGIFESSLKDSSGQEFFTGTLKLYQPDPADLDHG